MTEFMVIATIVAILIYGFNFFTDGKDTIAVKLRKDGKYEYQKVSSQPQNEVSLWLKIIIFIMIASVLFMPLDFILNRL